MIRSSSIRLGFLALALGLTALLLAGCAKDEEPAPQPSAATTATFGGLDVMSSALAAATGAPPIAGPAALGRAVPMGSQVQALVDHAATLGSGGAMPFVTTLTPLDGTYPCYLGSPGTVDIVGSANLVDGIDPITGYGTFTVLLSTPFTATYNNCSDGFYTVDGGPVNLAANDSISVSNVSATVDQYTVSIDESMSGSGISITDNFGGGTFTVTFSAVSRATMDFTIDYFDGSFAITAYTIYYRVTANGQTCTVTANLSGYAATCSN